MAERGEKEAFVTLATNDTYALGCLVLGNSLKQRAKTTRKLVVMVTQGVTGSMRNQLARVFDMIYDVNLLDSRDSANLQLLGRPDLSVTFTKLHCWRLTMFEKCIFLDADTLVLQNVDELFDREELSAAPDAGWPDCFNSGVFVFRPSEETYNSLLAFAMSQGSFDGGDQGLLNMYFRDWATKDIARHLPFIYNVVSQAFYSYLPAFTQFKNDVKIVHFIGASKPWHHPYNTTTKEVTPLPESGHNKEFLQIWWDIFMTSVQSSLDPTITTTLFSNQSNLVEGLHPPQDKIPAIIPYQPPALDDVTYTTNVPENALSCNTCEVKEIPVITRMYSELESYYSEEPISVYNPECPPTQLFDIPQVVNTWAAANVPKNENKSCDLVVDNLNDCDEKTNKAESVKNLKEEHACPVTDNNENILNEENIDSCDKETCETSEGGLIGELASLSLHGGVYPASQENLSDQERKLNWERGQMDYLGADKFENIQKKLDKSLEGPAVEPTAATSSPFSKPPETQKEPVKKSTATFQFSKK